MSVSVFLSVCLCVCSHIKESTRSNFTKIFVLVDCGRRCSKLFTSGFADDIFHIMGFMVCHVYS